MSDQTDLALRLEQPLREAHDMAYALHLACRGLHPEEVQPSDEEMHALIAVSDTLCRRLTQLKRDIRSRD